MVTRETRVHKDDSETNGLQTPGERKSVIRMFDFRKVPKCCAVVADPVLISDSCIPETEQLAQRITYSLGSSCQRRVCTNNQRPRAAVGTAIAGAAALAVT